MIHPPYPAAREAAVRVHPHFVEHLMGDADLLLSPDMIEAMIDVAFWASLRREELYTPRISLAFAPACRVALPLYFERPIPLDSHSLARLGPAVERPGIHLCVARGKGDLEVWGSSRNLPDSCFVLEVVAPGLVVVKRSRGDESAKFVNVAVLQGDEIKVIDPHAATAPDCPGVLTSLLGLPSQVTPDDPGNVLIQLAVSMRAHGRGGLLLVVPAGTSTWQESLLHPILYSVSPPFSGLADLLREDTSERPGRRWQEALRRVVEGVAGLTAVDGAVVITDRYELLAFGGKIIRPPMSAQVSVVLVTEPIEGSTPLIAEPGQLGGTRHLSAAQFAHDQRDAIALVASQDGRFTVFGWSPCEEMVNANRIESLLL